MHKFHLKLTHLFVGCYLLVGSVNQALAEFNWVGITVDNDIFVGSDDGYTNGLYVSLASIAETPKAKTPNLLIKPFTFLLSDRKVNWSSNAYTFGQTMATPEDITLEVPEQNDLPYTGILFFTTTHLRTDNKFSDDIFLTLGLVGPLSFAAESQEFVHRVIGSDIPQGWDTQLDDELVFRLGRGRTYRILSKFNDRMDVLFRASASVGTLISDVELSGMLRFGQNIRNSYASASLISNRTLNPIAIDHSWYFYIGIGSEYVFNSIFLDGNTFVDSPSIDYEPLTFAIRAGVSYGWEKTSLTLAIEDRDIFNDSLEGLDSQYYSFGTITLAWQI